MKAKLTYITGMAVLNLNILFFVAYNLWFGWNMFPQSTEERICDFIFHSLTTLGFVIMFWPAFKLYEKWIEKQ